MKSKYLVANIAGNTIVLCSIVLEDELKEAVMKIVRLTGEQGFDVDAFCEDSSAGGLRVLANGTTIQFLYLSES